MRVWVLLPAFNEEDNLPPLFTGLAAAIAPTGLAARVVVVDDGSADGTARAAAAGAALVPVDVIRHEQNRGLARAVETGLGAILREADPADVVVTMDADNTHPAALIPVMVDAVARGADVVIASRFAPGGAEEGVPALRRLLSRGVGLLMRLRFRVKGVRDYSSGYRAYRASLLQAAGARYGERLIESQGFTVMAEVLVKLRPFSPRVVEVPLHLRYDLKGGKSKMRLAPTIRGYVLLLIGSRG